MFWNFRKLSQGFQLCYLTRNLSWSEVKMRNVPKSEFYPIVWRFDRIFPTFFSSLLWFFWNKTIWRDFQNLDYTPTVWQNFATVFQQFIKIFLKHENFKIRKYWKKYIKYVNFRLYFTVFENRTKKSHLTLCERSELRLHFEWTKLP